MVEQKEVNDFVVREVGALVGAAEKGLLEANYYANVYPKSEVVPYVTVGSRLLPPGDVFIVAGTPVAPWVAGYLVEEDAKKRGDSKTQEIGRNVKIFGEGDALYAVPTWLHIMLIRVLKISTPTPGPGLAAASVRGVDPSRGSRPPASVVYRL
jgi:hypothetical protein